MPIRSPRHQAMPPYRRKVMTFKSVPNHKAEVKLVQMDWIQADRSEFSCRYNPAHPT
ncbi:MAG: hypothetical protein FD153_1978, partial [Rhodospirillaceae bacterium]